MNALLLLLGGSGERFGANKPKQFIEIEYEGENRPLFEITARKLLRALPIDLTVFVAPKGTGAYVKQAIAKLKSDFPERKWQLTAGGATRHVSFLNGLGAAEKFANLERLVVHDANRPYLSANFLARVSSHMGHLSSGQPAFIPVLAVVDSVVRLDGKNIVGYENRQELYRVQTPQLLYYPSFAAAQRRAFRQNRLALDFTDEGSVCLSLGMRVGCFEGDEANRKITYAHDLEADKL